MGNAKRLVSVTSAAALALLFAHGSAFGQQNKDQQKCINGLLKDGSKVAKAQSKENGNCVKALTTSLACTTADPKGKVAKKKQKTIDDRIKNCTTAPTIGFLDPPNDDDNVNTVAMDKLILLLEEVFGSPGPVPGTKCQQKVWKRVNKLLDTKWKQYNGCVKTAIKAGGGAVALDNCVIGDPNSIAADPKGKIAKAVAKIGDDITKQCGGNGNGEFLGTCDGLGGNALRDCLDQRVECMICWILFDILGITVDCDLFDDGLANGSCNHTPQLGEHKCTLDVGSQLTLHSALPLPPLPATGAVDIDCGSVDGGTGKAPCECSVQAPGFGALNIAGLFFACVKPAISASCPTGEIDCDGGNQLGLDMAGARNIGACVSNASCAASCAALCAPDAVFTAQCEGFCTLGTEMACLTDAACGLAGEGSCNGPDGVGFGNICDCTCLNDSTGGASSAGDLACQLAFNLTVEPNPGNGMACDGADVSINVGDTCSPLSTQSATAILTNGNNLGLVFPPGGFAAAGAPLNCANFATSDTTGAQLVGSAMFYASTIGDINTQLQVNCQ
jgi:hypothetical protein